MDYRASPSPSPEDPALSQAYPALYAIAALATGEPDDGAAQSALDAVVRTFNAPSGCLLLINPDSGRLEMEAQYGLPDSMTRFSFEMGQGLPGWVSLHGQPALAPNVAQEPRYRALRDQTQCQMAAPLMVDGNAIGVMVVDHDNDHGFTSDDLQLLVRLTDETARVMRRLWLLGQLQGKANQLESLITVGQSLVGKLAPQELFDSLTRDTQRMMNGQASALFLYEGSRDSLRCVSLSSSREMTLSRDELPADECLVGVSAHTRRQTEFANIQSAEYRDLIDLPDDPELHSVLITPLNYENETLGALAIFNDQIQRFDNDAKRLTAGLASLGSVAMENVRLYARVFQSEDTLRKNEQLTTLGLLAAEIAHEIRNPLTVLKLLHGGLGLDFPEDDPRRTDMRVIGEKLDQLEEIVTRVLQFGKSPTSNLHSRWSLADIISDTLVLVRLKLAQGKIQLNFSSSSSAPIIEGHKGQIQQVLLNLLLNASQAMPDGGSITLALNTESDHATLDITDTGRGIPEEIRDLIFDSFLSGRPDGTGLGLAIAKRILLGHHGDIALVSSGPEGTTLRITLPLAN